MARTQKDTLLPEARALFAEGASKRTIAVALGVSASTVRRWAREDAAAGERWSREPPQQLAEVPAHCPAQDCDAAGSLADGLCRRLEARLERLLEEKGDDVASSRLEDHMLKICKLLELLRSDTGDLQAQLTAMKSFAAFCVRNLPEDEMTPVRRAVRLFLDELRRDSA